MRTSPLLIFLATSAALTLGSAAPVGADPVFYDALSYRQASDSPVAVSGGYWFLEDFEDGLNSTGVSASGGLVIGWDPYVDSVDGDDGILDGSGATSGHSWYSLGLQSVTFSFDRDALGVLPTHAGIVWTDIGYNAPTSYFGPVFFEAFGADGASLGLLNYMFGDGMDTGQTAEDRFFGVFDERGISSIRVGTNNGDWEVDHLQYGAAVPVAEPSTLILFAIGAAGFFGRRAGC